MKKSKKLLSSILVCCLAIMLFPISVSAASVTDRENNDSVGAAQVISLGDSISGAISEGWDVDFYEFTLTESGKVSITVTAYMEYYNVRIYNTSGDIIWSSGYGIKWNEAVGFQSDGFELFLELGTYYLEMNGREFSNGASKYPGSYTIKTSFDSANATETEPNNSANQANKVSLGGTIRGVISENGDYDLFLFVLTEASELSLDVTAYMEYYNVRIYDTSGDIIWSSVYGIKWNEAVGYQSDSFNLSLEAGTYYLEMSGRESSNGKSKYSGIYNIVLGNGISTVNVTDISLDSSSLTLAVGNMTTLTATVKPSDADDQSVRWSSNNTSVATVSSSGVVTAKAKGKAVITAKTSDGGYTATCTVTVTDNATNEIPFKDVPTSAWYYEAVQWAVGKQITSGTGSTTFSPNNSCTRAQAVTLLWRAAGKPEPTSVYNPFVDVNPGDYYYKAVLWAVENGITSGTSSNIFSPDSVCQRNQIVTFLYRYAGTPTVSGSNSFNDVSSGSYYYSAVQWAVKNEITSGTGNKKFSPESTCTRAQIVTFLYRYLAE